MAHDNVGDRPPAPSIETIGLDERLTTRQVAKLAKVKPETVQSWVRKGKLDGRKIGRQFLFLMGDVQRFLGR